MGIIYLTPRHPIGGSRFFCRSVGYRQRKNGPFAEHHLQSEIRDAQEEVLAR